MIAYQRLEGRSIGGTSAAAGVLAPVADTHDRQALGSTKSFAFSGSPGAPARHVGFEQAERRIF
jgi:hypothetical protein